MSTQVGIKKTVRAFLVLGGAIACSRASALGLGELDMQSFLNEPLRAQVELLDTRGLTPEDIRIRLAGVDDFERLGVDRSYFLTGIEFTVEIESSTGRGLIRLSSEDAVLEPFLDLIIEARWPSGRLLREYTILVDPPAFREEIVTVSASERVRETEEQTAPQDREPDPQPTTTGDRIRRRESNLGPGEMPSREFSSETSVTPAPGSRYMVRRDETLWEIALQGRPEGVSVQQAMLDIQRLNPEAFISGNINRIKAGYIIYLPETGDISSDDLAAALEQVREQNSRFQSSDATPGVSAAATLRISADTDTAPVPAGSDDSAGQGGGFEIDSSGLPASSGIVGEPGAPASNDDRLGSEVTQRLEEMTSRLDTLEQIVTLKDEQIATLEQALREATEAAEAARAEAQRRVAPVATTPAPQPAQTSSSGSIPWLPIGGGLLAILLGVFVFLKRRGSGEDDSVVTEQLGVAKQVDDDVFEGVSLNKAALENEQPAADRDDDEDDTQPEALAAPTEETAEPAEQADEVDSLDRGGSRGYGERKHDDYIDESAAGDKLAEADIYIAYGRYLQAIELLDSAIAEDPNNSAYRLKLIELYVDMGEEAKAAEQLEDLRKQGDTEATEKAEALVGGAGADSSASPFDEDDLVDEDELVEETFADSRQPGDLGVEPDEALTLDTELDTEAVEALSAPTLELEVDEELADAAGASEEAVDQLESAFDAEDGELVFDDLEIEDDSNPALEDELDFAASEGDLDLSDALVGDGEEKLDETVIAPLVAEDDTPTLDVDLDVSLDDDFDDSFVDSEELVIADDADQMATKLDLARAYLDMDDAAGAKTILEEVSARGSAEQKEEAQELIARIG